MLIIQFPHRKDEYPCNRFWLNQTLGITRWNPTDKHWRRLVRHKGEYVDRVGKKYGELAFWTEWEANTHAEQFPSHLVNANAVGVTAKWVHAVLKPTRKYFPNMPAVCDLCAFNTDPCVFGDTFKYCCCRQSAIALTKSILRHADEDEEGALIIFCSRLEGKLCVDTVIVIPPDKGQDYVAGNANSIRKLGTSQDYRNLTLDRLQQGCHYRFYRGATYQNQHEEMYSFTPARKWNDKGCGERFVLDLSKIQKIGTAAGVGNILEAESWRNIKKTTCSTTAGKSVWSEIVSQIDSKGGVLGVHFDWPTNTVSGIKGNGGVK